MILPLRVLRALLRVGGALGLTVLIGALPADAAASTNLNFEVHIRPILKAHCFHCHGESENPKAGLDLRLRRFMTPHQTEDDGTLLVSGEPNRSALLTVIRDGKMPKGGKGPTPAEVERIAEWIRQGAPTLRPEPESLPRGFYLTEEDRSFWSFQPIHKTSPPANREPNPIDAWVALGHDAAGLQFAPAADRRTLIRRLSLDLLGLPPTPEEVEAFVGDPASDAYERLVDRYLARPQYGERWGRHWLDIAGYADSNGFVEADSVRAQSWRYRDYVIRTFNTDQPWNEFIIEQLAGDELASAHHADTQSALADPRRREALIATGFLRQVPDGTGDGPPDPNLARNQVMAETLKVVSSAFLGLTVGCAQCHDHRYDPISQADYFRLRAIFEPALNWKEWRAPGERQYSLYSAEDRARAEAIEAEAKTLDTAADQLHKELLDQSFEKQLALLPEELRETVRVARNTEPDKRTPEQKELFKKYPSADVRYSLDLYDPEGNKKVTAKRAEANQIRSTKPPEGFVMALTEVADRVPDTVRHHRGDHDQPREIVRPDELEVLAPLGSLEAAIASTRSGKSTSGRRLAYAQWLTSGQHPLVARVLVNRFWQHHFGQGLVRTSGDFGHLGEAPTHPELLDWLAADFMEHGWKLKRLHRLIVTSRTYRQSSVHAVAEQRDPDHRWLARFPLRRLEAETLRDSLLAASGDLNLFPAGPPIPVARHGSGRIVVGEEKLNANGEPVDVGSVSGAEMRRSVYVQVRRSRPLTVLETFDLPVLSPNCERRALTTVAPQSLLLMNDAFLVEQGRHLARRLEFETGLELSRAVPRAWEILYATQPSDSELARCQDYYNRQLQIFRQNRSPESTASAETDALASLCQVLLSSNRFLYLE